MALAPRFWRLYASSATSNLADGVGRTAFPLLGATYTRNPVLISGLVTFAFLPWLLFALPSGALVDRVDRRYAMSAANAVRAVTSAALAVLVLADTATIGVIYVASFLLGLAETVYDSASRAILPQVVANVDLDRANGLLTVEETLGQTFLGAPIGSAIFAVALSLPLIVNASGFAVAALLVLTLRGSYRAMRVEAPTSIRADMRDGVRWLARHRFLRSLTMLSASSALFGAMTNGVFVLYVLDELRLPAGDFGFVLLGAGVGGLIGGLLAPPLARRFARGPILVWATLGTAVATGAMGLTRNGYLGSVLFGVAGLSVMIWNVLTMSLRQALIPHHLFGRVQGAYRTLVWGAIPVGALAGGVLAAHVGVRAVLVIDGVLSLGTTLVLAVVVRGHRDLLARGHATAAESPLPVAVS
ncbi:MAG: MFS transporter [Jatrophihabitantaceae bacterium]